MLFHSFIRLLIVLPTLSLTGGLFSGSSCPNLELPHGRIKIRSRGRIAKFSCFRPYILIGDNVATCMQGNWNILPPFCARTTCRKLGKLIHGNLVSNYRGAVLKPICDHGFTLIGSPLLYCRGRTWNDSLPVCQAESFDKFEKCNFEPDNPDQCNWINKHSELSWNVYPPKLSGRNYTSLPIVYPSFDHTLAPNAGGHYLHLEFYTNKSLTQYQNENVYNRAAEYISPLFPATDNATVKPCVIFWHYMYGQHAGMIIVNIGNDTVWQKMGHQGNRWQKTIINIGQRSKPFRITIKGYKAFFETHSNLAIDDLQVTVGPECDESPEQSVGYFAESEVPPHLPKATDSSGNVRYNLTNTVFAATEDDGSGSTTSGSNSGSSENFLTSSVVLEIRAGNLDTQAITVVNNRNGITVNLPNVEKSASSIDDYVTSTVECEYSSCLKSSSFPDRPIRTSAGWLEMLSATGDSLPKENTDTEPANDTYTVTLNDSCCSTVTDGTDLLSTAEEVSTKRNLPTSVTVAGEESSAMTTSENIADENRTDSDRQMPGENRTSSNKKSSIEKQSSQTANIDADVLSFDDLSVPDPIKNDEDDIGTARLANRKYLPSDDSGDGDGADKEGGTNDYSTEESSGVNENNTLFRDETTELNGTKELSKPIRRILDGERKSDEVTSSSEEMFNMFNTLDSDNLTVIADEATTAATAPTLSTANLATLADTKRDRSHERESEISTRPSVRPEKRLPNATWNSYAENHRNSYYNNNYSRDNINNSNKTNFGTFNHTSLRRKYSYTYNVSESDRERIRGANNKFRKIDEKSSRTDGKVLRKKMTGDAVFEGHRDLSKRTTDRSVISDGSVNKSATINGSVPTEPTANEQLSRGGAKLTATNNSKSIAEKVHRYKKKLLQSFNKPSNDKAEHFFRGDKPVQRLEQEVNGKSVKHAENTSYVQVRRGGNYYQTFASTVDISTSSWRGNSLNYSSVAYSTNLATDPAKVPPLTVKREVVQLESKLHLHSISSRTISLVSMFMIVPIFLLIMIMARNWCKRCKSNKMEGLLENTSTGVEMNSLKPSL